MSSTRRAGLPPSAAVGLELLRAAGSLLLLPARGFDYWIGREGLRAELAADLNSTGKAAVERAPMTAPDLPRRPLRIFLSCAEPSGELHGVGLVQALRRRLREAGLPDPELVGLGGERLAAEGVRLLRDPVSRAAMGFGGVGKQLPFYLGLLRECAACFRGSAPDLVLPIDSPALHLPLGRLARRYGVPVVHFVTPQYWGWAPWRAKGYRSAVDLALTILPFEPAWFERRGIPARHVGHPILDALPALPDGPRPAEGAPLVLLPGSRSRVIERNLPWMLDAVQRWRGDFPARADLPVLIPHDRAELRPQIEAILERRHARGRVELVSDGLHDVLGRARAALSVSGTVLLDLLHHRLPTAVIYRLEGPFESWLSRHFLTVPWFSSPNLLAGKELLPEFCFHGAGPVQEVSRALEQCYKEAPWRRDCVRGLERAAERLGPPGALDRVAAHALELLASRAAGASQAPAEPGADAGDR